MDYRTAIDQSLPRPVRRIKAKAGRQLRYVLGRFLKVNRKPVFVLGNQKSGTTVIAAALAHCAKVSVTLDIRDIRADLLFGLYEGSVSLSAFINHYRRSFARRVIKDPGLTFVFDKVRSRFPEGTFVFIVRDPRDNIRSILNRLELPGNASSLDPEALTDVHPIWREVVENKRAGAQGENYIETLAKRWNRATDVYLHNRDQMHLAHYESFCEDKSEYIRSLVQRVELTVKQPVSGIVQKQFQSKGNRQVAWEEFFGSENLSRIERICSENMLELGYASR